ncbi:respiratory nitrate reductase subunit gamma [Aeromonas caviae]
MVPRFEQQGRLVHVWSVPLEYLTRRIQIVRSRR